MDFEKDFSARMLKTAWGDVNYLANDGGGIPVIFIHGLGASSKTWKRFVKYLPDSMDVYLIDLLGHGRSAAPTTDYTIALQASVVEQLVLAENLRNYYLFGHSYGGWIAAYYAERHPEMAGLVLEDAAGMKDFAEHRIAQNPKYLEELHRNALALNPRPHVVGSIVDSYGASEELTAEDLGSIEPRTLVMWGGVDSVIDIKCGEMFHKQIGNSEFQVIADTGHTPHYEKPEVASRIFLDFVGHVA